MACEISTMGPVKNNRPRCPEPTRARAEVLAVLSEQPDPVSIRAIAGYLGRHPNTLREQIEWLLEHGLVRRHRVPGPGRGRPAWHYEAVGPVPASEDYAELAASLAWSLAENSDDPLGEAARTGRSWGAELCREHGVTPAPTESEGRQHTVELLDRLGYRPIADESADRVDLTRCPLLQAAHEHPDIVCTVHLGIVGAILSSYGADPDRLSLEPFAGRGICRLRLLTPAPEPTQPEPESTPLAG